MIPEINECKKYIREFEEVDIDVKKLLECTVKSEMYDNEYYVFTNDGYCFADYLEDISESDVEFGSAEYYDVINKIIKGEDNYYRGVYIALAFASPEKYYSEVDTDDEIYGTGITICKDHYDIILSEKDDLGSEDSSFGVLIKNNEQFICWRGDLGGHVGCPRIMALNEYLDEPLHRIIIKLVTDKINSL